MEVKGDCLFEVSWEVCNKVGGIFTVIKSKTAQMMKHYKNFFLIGPYFQEKCSGNFQELPYPDEFKQAFAELLGEGIIVHYGRWLIEGEPNVILVDFSAFARNKDNILRELWDNFQIDSLNTAYFDYGEPVVWAYAVGKLIEKIVPLVKGKAVAQFHEWLSGAGLLYLKKKGTRVAKVFTTHATMLGRTMAGKNMDLYNIFDKIDPIKEAYNYGIQAKHLTEMQCALNADVFTTVSEITYLEAKNLLKKEADFLLPNGLDFDSFPTFDEISIKHRLFKNRIKEFLVYYFFPYYYFDLNKTLICFIACRYEFHTKGIDIFIKALAKLNERLRSEKSEKTMVAFFWVPADTKRIKPTLLENQKFFNDIKDDVDAAMPDVRNQIIYALASQKELSKNMLFDEEFIAESKTKILRLKRTGKPPLSTHDLKDENEDMILNYFYKYGLDNEEEDRVKVVYYPIYLTGADGLLDTNYYETMLGSNLGVFPSFYEPWGYTPLEGGALGICSVTTDLAGFGRYLQKMKEKRGIFVLKRMGKTDDEVVEELAHFLYTYSELSKHERVENKIAARRLASRADWKIMIGEYIKAHNLAVERVF